MKDYTPLLKELNNRYGTIVTRQQCLEVAEELKMTLPFWLSNYKIGRSKYDITKHLERLCGTVIQREITEEEPEVILEEKTDDELLQDQIMKFGIYDSMVSKVITGEVKSLIVSGNPGIGKTYNTEKTLEQAADNSIILYKSMKGYSRATGLYRMLYETRYKECVLLIDDCDSIFYDEIALSILKAALDTSGKRTISWKSEKKFEDEAGEDIPDSFEFEGSVIFITNLDFLYMISKDSKISTHLSALVSRSFYIPLNLKNKREQYIRLKYVSENTNMLYDVGLTSNDITELLHFLSLNYNNFRELSTRELLKVGKIKKMSSSLGEFYQYCKLTIFKQGKEVILTSEARN